MADISKPPTLSYTDAKPSRDNGPMIRILLIILIASLLPTASAQFRVGISDEYVALEGYIINDFQELYQRAGITEASIETMPGGRILGLAKENRLDAIDARIISSFVDTDYLAIKVPIYLEVGMYAYRRANSDIEIRSTEDLANHRVLIVRHTKWSQDLLKNNKKIEFAPSAESSFQMLAAHRADVIILTDFEYQTYIAQGFITADEVVPTGPALTSDWLYHFVHRRHADKVELLEGIIRDMKSEGKFVLR